MSFEPKILSFLCNWCAYAGADLAGISRFQYPPNTRTIRVMCSGRIDPAFIPRAFRAGFDGVMVDTALKQGRSLCDAASSAWLADFVARSRARGLMCGLAGSLRIEHIDALAALAPDYLGFRGALCVGRERGGELDSESVRRVRQRLQAVQRAQDTVVAP